MILGLVYAPLSLTQTVEIPDPAFEIAIRKQLAPLATDELTVADMERLTVLDARLLIRGLYLPPIRSLEGIEAAMNLEEIDLSGGNLEISDLSPLSDLPKLKRIILAWNPTYNVLQNDLVGKPLTTLSLPEGFINLEELDLSSQSITQLQLPESLPNLRKLDLGGNPLVDWDLPKNLTNLEILDLTGNKLESMRIPSSLKKLRILRLPNNELTQPDLPDSLPNLEFLYLGHNQLTELHVTAGTRVKKGSTPHAWVSWPPDLSGVDVVVYPNIRNLTRSATGAVQFEYHAQAGDHRVQRTKDLTTWTDVGVIAIDEEETNGALKTGVSEFVDSTASDLETNFYRVFEILKGDFM